MIKLPPASVHVSRHLDQRELKTIEVGLDMLARSKSSAWLDEIRAGVAGDVVLLSDDEIRSLIFELMHARKIKVCRTKNRQP